MDTGGVVTRDHSPWSPRVLMVTDGLALFAFVLTGSLSHHDVGVLAVLVRNLGPLSIAWVIAAACFGVYRRGSWGVVVLAWAAAVPLSLVVRSWLVGSPRGGELVTFLLVGSGFSLLYLLIGRGLLAATERLRARRVST